jgi:hypothetical protein
MLAIDSLRSAVEAVQNSTQLSPVPCWLTAQNVPHKVFNAAGDFNLHPRDHLP